MGLTITEKPERVVNSANPNTDEEEVSKWSAVWHPVIWRLQRKDGVVYGHTGSGGGSSKLIVYIYGPHAELAVGQKIYFELASGTLSGTKTTATITDLSIVGGGATIGIYTDIPYVGGFGSATGFVNFTDAREDYHIRARIFEYTKSIKRIISNDVYGYNTAFGNLLIFVTGIHPELKVGQYVYFELTGGTLSGLKTSAKVMEIITGGGDTSVRVKHAYAGGFSAATGSLAFNDLVEYVEDGPEEISSEYPKFYADPTGKIKVDIQSWLQPLINANDEFDYTAVSATAPYLGQPYNVQFVEWWDNEEKAETELDEDQRHYIVNAVKQVGDRFGQNMGEHVLFAPYGRKVVDILQVLMSALHYGKVAVRFEHGTDDATFFAAGKVIYMETELYTGFFEITDYQFVSAIPVAWSLIHLNLAFTTGATNPAGSFGNLSNSRGKFLTMFPSPVYFEGYPFDLSFIYSKEYADSGVYVGRTELVLDASGETIHFHFLTLPERAQFVNRLMLEGGYPSNAKKIDFTLGWKDVYVEDGYVDEDYVEEGIGEKVTESIIIEIGETCRANHIYLKWLNPKGGFDYYLFDSSQIVSDSIKEEGTFDNYIEDLARATSRVEVMGKSVQEEIILGAENLTRDKMQGLRHLFSSPKVYRYTGLDEDTGFHKWQGVRIKEGSFEVEKTDETRADIEFIMLPPERYTQRQ